jgi:hypothetical protein
VIHRTLGSIIFESATSKGSCAPCFGAVISEYFDSPRQPESLVRFQPCVAICLY